MNLIIMGAPGSGKGTQGLLVAHEYGLRHISTGQLFRQMAQQDTPLGRAIKKKVEHGVMVSSKITIGLIKQQVAQSKKGFILDGFPRTVKQATALDHAISVQHVIYLTISDTTAIQRILDRVQCLSCHTLYTTKTLPKNKRCTTCNTLLKKRSDDTIMVAQKRLRFFHKETEPVLVHYKKRHMLIKIDGEKPIQTVFTQIKNVLKKD
ncbi:MAG: nucleoside monophosphate kinase [Candidatus Aenigmarchaeota archaeon]|nr:nucleoside monophosphate kinase [Candidatus Aenigmarchaeota archaeon]